MSAHLFSDDLKYDMSKLGMWLFLATEVLLFTGLFTTYAIFRFRYSSEFSNAASELSVMMGTINTIVLLLSSLTVALSIEMMKTGNVRVSIALIVATLLCAVVFLVIKYFEYSAKIHHGLFPSSLASNPLHWKNGEVLFFVQYFIMTGIHGLHILIGMGVWIYVIVKMVKGTVHPGYFPHLEVSGLYWHLVDLIWIFLFPMLYLIA